MLNASEELFAEENLEFWKRMSKPQREMVLNSATCVKYKKGESLHDGVNNCLGLVLVMEGRLRIFILSEEGKEVTLFRLNPSEACVLSASCILKNITFDVHIEAEKDSSVIIINPKAFENLCLENVYAENFSYKVITAHFSEVMWAMEQILFMSFEKRLAIFLIDQSSLDNSEYISMTHEEIANHMGSAREVVSRMLKYFQNEGIVELSRGDIKIIDKKKLRALAL
ncbi:MAG: Transcriptional activator protein Anr [Firmicutes bacterium ADurb.Bin193]|nr:MAG: Transcriptional activator protein Anr [Firmicutes bacterium ADurb.Bin193]